MGRIESGKEGEKLAVDYLVSNGYEILEKIFVLLLARLT